MRWLVPVGLALLLAGCQEPEAQAPPAPARAPEATPAQPLRPAAELAEVLPRLKRDGSYSWRDKRTRVPGHFAAWLYSSEPKRRLFVITVDDLRDQPERLALYRSMTTTVGKHKGRIVTPDWIEALVAGRYEVRIRADHEDFRSRAKLALWFDKMRLSKLEELEKPRKK
jgi:hypothetical protein